MDDYCTPMANHINVELKKNGKYINPTSFVCSAKEDSTPVPLSVYDVDGKSGTKMMNDLFECVQDSLRVQSKSKLIPENHSQEVININSNGVVTTILSNKVSNQFRDLEGQLLSCSRFAHLYL